ncbi:hypothetical protein [Halobacterium zhouii]|uniref:hypothetical protein n=1 Tax=Halobacterium zhouii TaxID=2902624 RepID=UPI001E4AE550|nr:hypothetical protein [Halobacterium zhouii]
MSRMQALIVVLVITGVGGCLSADTAAPGNTQETSSPAPTTARSVEFPSKPATLTAESVRQYVESYERAHRKQAVYDEHDADGTEIKRLVVSLNDVSVEPRGEHAFLVTLQYMTGYTTVRGTTRVAHDTRFTARYYVNDSTTLRTATVGIDGTGLDPIENGTAVSEGA